MKNELNFTKGEWIAAVVLLLIIIGSYLVYYLYDDHKKPTYDAAKYQATFVAFEVRQQYLQDSVEAAYKEKGYRTGCRYDKFTGGVVFDTFPPSKTPKKQMYEIVKLDLNHCDTDDIVNVPQFGSKRAAKLVEYRQRLGGFYSFSQVQEVYILQSVPMDLLEKYFYLNPKDVAKININTATYKEMMTHPYFDAYLSKTIVNYRTKHGNIRSFEELQQITHAYPELMDKLRHYVVF